MKYKITFPDGKTTIIESNTAYGASFKAERLYPQYDRCEVETYSVEQEDRQRWSEVLEENELINSII